ncbi:ABC transporter permease [Mycetocola reblochoni]|nr:ABC transporter permease [Mycetocola reblochoni]
MIGDYAATTAIGGSAGVERMLTVLSILFLGIAVFVAGVVTTNTFSTIIAGRVHEIALARVLGASARDLRRSVATEGAVVGLLGSVLGVGVGWAVAALVGVIGRASGVALPVPEVLDPVLAVPLVASALTTWLASWLGGARVLTVTPMQALGSAEEAPYDRLSRRPVRTGLAVLAVAAGAVGLGAGVMMGQSSSSGVLVAFLGGVLSFIGVIGLSRLIIPPVLRVIGTLLGRGAPARLGAANAMRHPERSARSTVGIVIGVTLITTFVVAASTARTVLFATTAGAPEEYVEEASRIIDNVTLVFAGLIGFAVVIALVGLVNTLTLGVMQRRREIGLLRAVGFTRGQVRRMITAESAQGAIAATAIGVLLGVVYGWSGALALLGSVSSGAVWPTVPLAFVAAVVVVTAAVALLAALIPSRRATRVTPVAALAVD